MFPFTYAGTFTIDSDCTGALTRDLSIGGPTEQARLVVVGDGKRIFLIGTFPGGRAYSGELERVGDD